MRGVALGALLVPGLLVGCGRNEFKDRTAVVVIGGSRETFVVDSCGLDGRTVFLVARSSGGSVLQGVMGVRKDHKTGVRTSTGLTVDLDPASADTRVAAFGAESWSRRGSAGPAPGTITAARLRGSRIQFSGEVVPVDANDLVVPGAVGERFSVDARCDRAQG